MKFLLIACVIFNMCLKVRRFNNLFRGWGYDLFFACICAVLFSCLLL